VHRLNVYPFEHSHSTLTLVNECLEFSIGGLQIIVDNGLVVSPFLLGIVKFALGGSQTSLNVSLLLSAASTKALLQLFN